MSAFSWGLGLTQNTSILAIPAYYILCITPHAYAIHVVSGGDLNRWDNRNPRANGLKDAAREQLGEENYLRYERAESAHYNSLENFPLFASAVVLGNIARLPIEDLNSFAIGMAALRTAYIVSYIRTTTNSASYVRSGIWFGMVGWCLRILWRSGKRLA